MRRTLIFTDLHAHAWQEFSSLTRYRCHTMNSRLAWCIRVIMKIKAYCRKHDIREVIFGGDLFHRQRLIEVQVFNLVSAALWELSRVVDNLYLIAGNHDLVTRSAEGDFSEEHALRSLGKYKRVHVVDRAFISAHGYGMIPYAQDRETVMAGVEALLGKGVTAAVMHVGVNGAKTGPIEYQPLEPVSVSDLPREWMVYSGHYHYPHKVTDRFVYVGAPLEFVRGDGHHDDRGWIVARGHKYERVPFKGPRIVQIRDTDHLPSEAKGNFVDLIVTRSDTDESQLYADLKVKHGAEAVVVKYDLPTKGKKARIKVKGRDGQLPTVSELCKAHVKRSGDGYDARKLKALAREILTEAETNGAGTGNRATKLPVLRGTANT